MRAKRAWKNWNWTVASKHVIIECERSELEILSNWNFGKFCTFPPNSSKLRSDYLFSLQKRRNCLFPAFSRLEYIFPKSASPPSPQNQMVIPLQQVTDDSNATCVIFMWKNSNHILYCNFFIINSRCSSFKTNIQTTHTNRYCTYTNIFTEAKTTTVTLLTSRLC